MKREALTVSLCLLVGLPCLAEHDTRPRIIVTTDITNEPDDQQSLVRLLAHANDFSIEGLIGSTGIWMLSDPATHVIHECIDGYGEVRDNLVLHDPDYPTAEYLHSVAATGNRAYGMSGVGERGSEGAELIVRAADKDDPRPVWLLAWGGANTIAQAIWTVRETRSPEELSRFLSRIRIYDLACQDDAGAWIARTFPDVFMVRNVLMYKGMSYRFSSEAWDHTRGGDETVVDPAWVKTHIQENHGALGALYPNPLHIYEGDTPTYFYVKPNGLNDPEQQWQGSWGGRFGREKEKNVNVRVQEYAGAACDKGCWVNENPYLDYWVYADAEDHWEYGGASHDNRWATIFRWRTDFQNEFAARMDWCVNDYAHANHNPIAVVDGDQTRAVLYRDAQPGERVWVDASQSEDPDGDELEYEWWIYPEAGTYRGAVEVLSADAPRSGLTVPEDANGKTIHLMLTLRDGGSPPLASYRRIVLRGAAP